MGLGQTWELGALFEQVVLGLGQDQLKRQLEWLAAEEHRQ
jgi:hypothetical protein